MHLRAHERPGREVGHAEEAPCDRAPYSRHQQSEAAVDGGDETRNGRKDVEQPRVALRGQGVEALLSSLPLHRRTDLPRRREHWARATDARSIEEEAPRAGGAGEGALQVARAALQQGGGGEDSEA